MTYDVKWPRCHVMVAHRVPIKFMVFVSVSFGVSHKMHSIVIMLRHAIFDFQQGCVTKALLRMRMSTWSRKWPNRC